MNDLIDRQAAIDAVQKELTEWEHSHVFNIWTTAEVRFLVAEVILKKIPPAEPKTGHWIKISPAGIYECSQCGQNVMTGDIEVYAYCHHCGARMEGGKP